MANLFPIHEHRHQRLTVAELLDLLGPEPLTKIDRDVRLMRETFHCPYTVEDYEGFKAILFSFYAHYAKAFYGVDMRQATDQEFAKNDAYRFLAQYLGSYRGGIQEAERNAIAGRDGGMIGVIDALTEGVLKLHTETYIRAVFFERIPPNDYETKMRLANELLSKYGALLFPNEQLYPNYAIAMNIEDIINAFANNIHSIRRQLRH